MKQRQSPKLNQKGWTLVELMLVTALIGIITPAMTMLFSKVSQGFAADEMHTQLKKGNQEMLNRVHVRLEGSKHLFMGDSSGVSFLKALNILSSAPTTLLGTLLAQPQTSVSGSFGASVTDFQPANIGNALLFASYDSPQTIVKSGTAPKIYLNSPMTVSGAGITDVWGTPRPRIIDLYRFNYYYLTTQVSKPVKGVTLLGLVEWESIRFADYFELSNISDTNTSPPGLLMKITQYLYSQGVSYAWDPSQTNPDNAFYDLSGNLPALTSANFTIPQEQAILLTRVSSGILGSGFGYGISPNTRYWPEAPVQVPQYAPTPAAAANLFPGGFEIGVGGVSSGRKILVRGAWVAKGAAPRVVYNDISMVNEIRDVW